AGKQGVAKLLGLDPTLGEAAGRVGEEALYGAAGEVVGAGIGKLGREAGKLARGAGEKILPHTARELESKSIGELRQLAMRRGLKDADWLPRKKLEEQLLKRPSLPKEEYLKAKHGIHAKFFEGRTTPKGKKVASLERQRIKPSTVRALAARQGPIDAEALAKERMGSLILPEGVEREIRREARGEVAKNLKQPRAELRRRLNEEYRQELGRIERLHVDPELVKRLPLQELRRYAGQRKVAPRALRQDLVREIYGSQLGPRMARLAGRGVEVAGRALAAPGRALKRATGRLVEATPYGKEMMGATIAARGRAAKGIHTFIDDAPRKATPQKIAQPEMRDY